MAGVRDIRPANPIVPVRPRQKPPKEERRREKQDRRESPPPPDDDDDRPRIDEYV